MEFVVPEDIWNIYKSYLEDVNIPKSAELDKFMMDWSIKANAVYVRGYKAGYMSWKENKEDGEAFHAVYKYSGTLDAEITNLKTAYSLYRLIDEHFIYQLINEESKIDIETFKNISMIFEEKFYETVQKIDNCNKEFNDFYSEWRGKYHGENQVNI